MDVCCECCVLSGRGLCDGLISRPEESYRMWRVVVCDQETSKTKRLKPATGLWKIQPQWVVTPGKQTNKQIKPLHIVWIYTVNYIYNIIIFRIHALNRLTAQSTQLYASTEHYIIIILRWDALALPTNRLPACTLTPPQFLRCSIWYLNILEVFESYFSKLLFYWLY
jgi:hypothetical protein